ncbi:nicotinamide-nucleotide amidohydrolase family protein [Alteromonas sp. ASW11-19]|uniref:Nicotinamide-nucleotide amidohydrolase family protein n=1 Tax=Alteromonas salexigens TaxID=2982530 RepID=A0ABT2VRL7_9ALTE|nr:nicotinamide-nucleotide amidohydrolase family protein [Alteromonas salexigens]MCU7554861.1 nicotinamide-nucleotide amidohydrolase family protein [Alteromonas salexigens]
MITESAVLAFGERLRERGWSVSCAESCTGGGIAHAFTSVAGSSDWFNVSWVTYSNAAKQQALGVQAATLAEHGAVSEAVVREMVTGVHHHSGADLAVAVSGIAGPGGGSPEKPVGTVWFGFYCRGDVLCTAKVFAGDRSAVREQAVEFAIQFLDQWLVVNAPGNQQD